MPKRRANGEGNIRKRKDGRWEGRYTVGHDPETGKAIIKNVLGKTQAEVKEKLKKAIEENVGIDYGRAKTYTVGSWLEVWMENYAKVKLRPSTFKTSQGFLKNHIKPQIGSIPLADLTSLDLQRFYKHLLDGGRVDRIEAKKKPKGLAPKTVRNIHQMIGSAYNLAMEQKLVSRNPTQGCALPKVEHKEMKTLTADQLSAFFQEARDSGVYELYYLDLATGLRRGELLGLKWTDIDLDRGVLKIQRAISRQNGKVLEAPLKTKNAYRTLPLSADAIDVLKAQKNKVGSSEWVFPSPTGGPMSPDSVLHMLHRVLKRAGLPRIRFHDLRHTFATMSLENGMDVKTLSSIIGHVSSQTTLDIYLHSTQEMRRQAAKKIDSGIGKNDGVSTEDEQTPDQDTNEPCKPKFEAVQGKIRKAGTGCLYQVSENLWEGSYFPRLADGKRKKFNVYAKTREECEVLLAEMIPKVKAEIAEAKANRKVSQSA